MNMTARDKVSHVLRRFGLGASDREQEHYTKMGLDNALNELIHYEGVPEEFNLSPWSFAFDAPDKVGLEPQRFVSWWTVRMLLTRRPLQENLTLFWHNHFAVSGSKVTFGPMMLGYLNTLRENANGNFRTLLGEVARDPAMLRWLDTDLSVKGRPNENFAREVMELFTLGVGNYTEKDVQEAARAFTGWSIRSGVIDTKLPQYKQVQDCIAYDRPLVVFTDSPALHDSGFKTILGKRAQFTQDMVLDLLANRPESGRFIMKKVWEWFAYEDPEPVLLEKLVRIYFDNKLEIKPVLHWIAQSNEFWSERCVRSKIKSPVAYTIGIARQLQLGELLAKQAPTNPSATSPIPKIYRDTGNLIASMMNRQGLALLFPPDVSGWKWGTHWITSASMLERERIGDFLFKQRPNIASFVAKKIIDENAAQTSAQFVDGLSTYFDVPLDPGRKEILAKALDSAGGVGSFAKPQTAAKSMTAVFKLVASIPEFQFC